MKVFWHKIFNIAIKGTNILSLTTSVILFAALLIVFIQALAFREYELLFTREGVLGMQTFWEKYGFAKYMTKI